ncbi:MAG: glycogen/starch/alpha-glucan phosphorylase, partial [Eggerthellaceae bacterium]|nr:glycogen/starch/alpha-glucan phosphorylase [Eggerthellaceae bacterium]
EEPDPGLGNGGLGRLAACYVDAMAHLGINGNGNGIHYRYGMFKQAIVNGVQVELPDNWLEKRYLWERRNSHDEVVVKFGGHVNRHEKDGSVWYTHDDAELVRAIPYDVPVVGYGGSNVNNLRLWEAEPYQEKFDMEAFNRGDYANAIKQRSEVESITYMLYPSDEADPGKVLRLKQEYMFVAAGVKTIVRSFKSNYGNAWKKFPKLNAIQTNDTHPALCGPELLRILIDEEGLDWDKAWDIMINTISYTNHTILPEALEIWGIEMFRALLPRVYMFIEEIDRRYRESFDLDKPGSADLLRDTSILWDGKVRMANLSVICGHNVNGVSAIHTEILKDKVLDSFYKLAPKKFSNKTNGVSHRRFLVESNRPLAKLITEAIGPKWIENAAELKKLEKFVDDASFMNEYSEVKKLSKLKLTEYMKNEHDIEMNPNMIFDVQVKRFHAYKRQLLNIFKVMHLYAELKLKPDLDIEPTTFIYAGKAAQSYEFAKDTIRLIISIANIINEDKDVKDKLQVVFVPNFGVSNAQLIYPSADISEQISTTGMEASGTGNMKFMMNGAVTLGTLDGANIEIKEQVGDDNIVIFGMTARECQELTDSHTYNAFEMYESDWRLRRLIDSLQSIELTGKYVSFNTVYDHLMHGNDEYFVLKDFDSYVKAWEKINKMCASGNDFYRMSLLNVANSGYFSADRSIREYAKDIWHCYCK